MVPDVNVLVAASRSDHPQHQIARSWLNNALAACAAGASLKLPPMVVTSFLRLVTHPRFFVTPTPVQEAPDPIFGGRLQVSRLHPAVVPFRHD
jgi:predicted nucleic acid-binding protein